MKEFLKKNLYIIAIVIIAIILIGYIYLDNTKQAHDLPFHLANIKNLISNNLSANLIMPNIGNNLGYGLYIFYPKLPHLTYAIVAAIISIVKIDIIDSVLITNILVSIVSSISMYILVLEISKNKKQAFISSIIYMLFPYRLGTITVRMAITENFAGIFIPIILLGIYYLFKDEKKKFYIAFVLGYAGLIFSHYIIAMYFSIFVFIILLCLVDKLFKEKRIVRLIIGTIAVAILVLPNIIIFLEHYNLDYLVYKENYVTNFALVKANILELKEYLIPTENYDWTIPYYIYCTVIGFCILSALISIKKHKREDIINILLIIFCIFIISFEGLWKVLPDMFYNIQFSWRIELILAVLVSIFAPKFLEKIDKKIAFGITVVLCILPSLFLICKLNGRIYHKDNTQIELEKGTGNLSEYYPNAYAYDKEYYENKTGIDIINGIGEVKITENKEKKLEFKVENSHELILELPRIYYKGYILEKDGEMVEIINNPYGLISLRAEDGEYKLEYAGTFLYNMFRIIRTISVITGVVTICIIYYRKRQR